MKTFIGHPGSLRGYRTLLRICPSDKIGVIVLTNSDDGEPLIYVEKVFEWVAPRITQVFEKMSVSKRKEQLESSQYIGKYRNVWRDLEVLLYDGELVIIDPSQSDPLSSLIRLTHIDKDTFLEETCDGYANDGEIVVFETNGSNEVHRLKIGENWFDRITTW